MVEPHGFHADHQWPQLPVYRGRPHRLLVEAVHEGLVPQAFLTGHQLAHTAVSGWAAASPSMPAPTITIDI
jgi:hypothetical protein